MTYRELVYMCLDEIKLASDDSYITEDHILFLISKYRAFLLRQKYDKTNTPVDKENFQYLRTIGEGDAIPSILPIAVPKVEFQNETTDPLDYEGVFIPYNRFKYVGNNKYITSDKSKIIYVTSDFTNSMRVKPCPDDIAFIPIFAVFEDILLASMFEFPNTDILDCRCPIEAGLVSALQELVVKDALGIAYRPKDIINNGNDDLSQIGAAVAASKKKE